MAAVDLTLTGKNNEKRGVSVAVGTIDVASTGTLASGDVVTLTNLPAGAVVTGAYFLVVTGPTTGTQTLTLKVGSTSVMGATAAGTADGVVKTATVTSAFTGTGAALTATVGTASLTDGKFEVVVEYIQHDKVNGELTTV